MNWETINSARLLVSANDIKDTKTIKLTLVAPHDLWRQNSDSKVIEMTAAVVFNSSTDDDIKNRPAVSEDSIDHEVKTSSRWRRILGYVWDSAEGTPRNRKYVQKLDAYML